MTVDLPLFVVSLLAALVVGWSVGWWTAWRVAAAEARRG